MSPLQNILDKINEAEEAKNKREESSFVRDERILKLNKNATYIGTLLPNKKDISNTFVRYQKIGFMSPITGKYIYLGRSPSDAGLKEDVVRDIQWKEYNAAKEAGDEDARKKACRLIPQKERVVNFFLHKVIGDDTQKSKEGTVVVLPYPAQTDKEGNPSSEIFKKIYHALKGDKAKKIGDKAFDLTAKGKTLIIKVTEKAGYNNYSETEFDDIEDDMVKSAAQIKEIEDSVHDLTEFIPEVKSKEELLELLNKFWYGKDDASPEDSLEDHETPDDDDDDDDDEIPGLEDDDSSEDSSLDGILDSLK